MSITYEYDQNIIQLTEKPNESDVEFDIRLIGGKYGEELMKIQKKFEENSVYTDVLFYPYENHHYRVIVRQDYYVDFILALMKYRLLNKVEWK